MNFEKFSSLKKNEETETDDFGSKVFNEKSRQKKIHKNIFHLCKSEKKLSIIQKKLINFFLLQFS